MTARRGHLRPLLKRRTMLRTITVAVAIAATAAALDGQQPPSAGSAPEQEGGFRFRSGVELINVTATVSDRSGHFVAPP